MIKEAIGQLVAGDSLSLEQSAAVMDEIMQGEATPAQFGAFVTALRLKGETVDEIAGMAGVMRDKALRVEMAEPVVDIVGTGGDSAGTFNISTTVAFVVAGAGLKVAKHGNRAMSSHCGSADVLEALGVSIDLGPEQVKACIKEVGMGFMFAQGFHPAMKYAGPPRREIGIRTVFNILGPLTNPAGAKAQLLGVADASLVEKLALVLQRLGCNHVLVVHGEDGVDEISLSGKTTVCELKNGNVISYEVRPEDFGFARVPLDTLKGGDAADNAAILRSVLQGIAGPPRDVVIMNAAAGLLAGDKVNSLEEGAELAAATIDGGKALATLEKLVEFSRGLK